MTISTTSVATTASALSRITIRKVRLLWAFAILGMIAGALLITGRAHADSLGFSVVAAPAPGSEPNDVSVVVVDDVTGAAISGASVVVSDSLQDSAGLRGQTGSQGSFLAKGVLAQGPRVLTVSKDGYSSIAIVGLASSQVSVQLKPLPVAIESTAGILASGTISSWPETDENYVTAGIVFKSMSAVDLLHFSMDSFVSPLKDTIDVFGSHDVPSNFVLPDQDISVVFSQIHLSKPAFRLPLQRGKPVQLAAAQGSIAVGDILSIVQSGGKMSMGLINKLKFSRVGLSAPHATDKDFSVSLAADRSLSPRHQVSPATPPFAADVLVAAATDMDGARGVLMPSDIKLAAEASEPGRVRTVTLSTPDNSVGVAHDVLTVAMADKGHRTSGIITDRAGANVAPGAFLPADALADAPALPETIVVPAANFGLSAAVFESQGTALLYVYALPGVGATQVPSKMLPAQAKITSYSVLNLDFGTGFDSHTFQGQNVMTRLQRFARSKADIGKQPALDSWDGTF